MNKRKICCIIPARGGSKGIKNKNIKLLCNKPLINYTIEEALKSKYLDKIILSTDDKKIAQITNKFGITVPFMRPKKLAKDNSPMLPVIKHLLNKLEKDYSYDPEIIILLQPTSPLRTVKHINEAIKKFLKSKSDSLVSVTKLPHNMNPYSIMKLERNGNLKKFLKYDEKKNLRQLKPIFYARNGAAIYITTKKTIFKKNSFFGDTILPYFMSKIDSIDIDDQLDWIFAETIIKNLKNLKNL
tara:strand:- start:99 stop:824 length:726 start_codon:yes stop_codon:yes gene_type:complete